MNYRRLGNADFKVSEIGFGAWGIGGPVEGQPAYGPTDDKESKLALCRAYDMGVTFFDTSDLYGYGHSEELIGEVFHNHRDKVIIATKVGFDSSGGQDFSPTYIRRCIEASLGRLDTDYIDLYQLHSPSIDMLTNDESIVAELQSLVADGKVRSIGLSARSPEDGVTAISNIEFASLQVNFNLVDQRAVSSGLLDLCSAKNVGVIARTPLCFGFLTGAYTSETEFALGDQRSSWSFEQRKIWSEAPGKFWEIVSEDNAQTASQLALRYCLSYSSVSTAIPGMLTIPHVEENVIASDMGTFSDQQLDRFEQIYNQTEFFLRG